MQTQKVLGTNCFNCMYVSKKEEPVDQKDLNNEGGRDPQSPQEMERAKTADLITLPGGTKADAKSKKLCGHPEIKMYVTERMCCAYWDNAAVKRPWKK